MLEAGAYDELTESASGEGGDGNATDPGAVDGGRLSGLAMVMDPASKSVNFAREAARRPVAMAAGGESGKALTRETEDMSDAKALADPDDIRSELEQYNIDTEGMDDDDIMEFAEALHEDLMDALEMESDGGDDEEDEEDMEAEGGEDDDEDEEEEDAEMADDDMEAMREQVNNLSSRLEDLEDAMSQAMTADDMDAELEDAAGNKLADAETVKTLKEDKADLEARVEELEDAPADARTLTDANDEFDPNWDPDTGTQSGW
jgi:preprotein translocase subunit SecD